jgi:hypothetical protein
MQNLVIPNKDNKVVYVFAGVDLQIATDIQVTFGSEVYTLLLNPDVVSIISNTELELDLSSTSEVGKIYSTVTYFDGGSVNGTDITSRELGNSDKIVVAIGTQLIIEDGSIVPNANSYVTDEEFKQYADLRNKDIPATQPDREALLIKAMDYLASKESKMQGYRVDPVNQSLPYPRSGVYLYCTIVPNNAIPQSLKIAQIEAALAAKENDLLVTTSSQNVASEKLGDMEVSYFSGGSWANIRLDTVDAQLNPLLVGGGNSNMMRRV